MAVVNDDIDALDAALAADCSVEHHNGDTPLMLAIRLRRTRIVEHLLNDIGVDVNFTSSTRPALGTAAAVAAAVGDERTMALLIQAGANLHARVCSRQDQLSSASLCHFAARNADAGVLRVLLDAGAPADELTAELERPIHVAAANENAQVMSLLLAAGCSLRPSRRHSVAGLAAFNRNEKVLAMLLDAGVDINSSDSFGTFPIQVAARNPNVAVIRLLIDAGVNVNVLDNGGANSLLNVCENPNVEVLDALLAAGVEWRASNRVFELLARNTNELVVRRVTIERGIDLNTRDWCGLTPLMTAAQSSTAAVVSVLLECGANVHATDRRGATACRFACENKNAGILRMLIAAGAPISADLLTEALGFANLDALQALVDAGMNVAGEFNANPSLMLGGVQFLRKHDGELLEFLIRLGVDFRVFHNGQTLCHSACRAEWVQWLAVLFARGVDLNARDGDGQTPIQVARPGAILTLIAAGVDCSQRRELRADERCLFAAVGHPDVSVESVSRRQLAWACNQIAERQFELLRLRAFQVCLGLEGRQLPALVTCEILAHAFAPLESLVAFHRVWAIVTTIKHFQRDSK